MERFVVFDDVVVYYCYFVVGEMWVGVVFGWCVVGCLVGMGDVQVVEQWCIGQVFFQVGDFVDLVVVLQFVFVIEDCYVGVVVVVIFEVFEVFDKDGGDVVFGDCVYDFIYGVFFFLGFDWGVDQCDVLGGYLFVCGRFQVFVGNQGMDVVLG